MELCPTCGRETPCPTCGDYDPLLSGAQHTRRFVLYRRVVHGLHQIRQSYAKVSVVLADETSDIIRRVEASEELGAEMDEEPTDVH